MTFKGLLCGVLAGACWTTAAGAQVIPEGVGVADRGRADYTPVGGRIGAFFLYPTAAVDAIATDNVRATPTDRVSDVFALVHADARLASNFARHKLDVRLFADQSIHAKATREDATEFGGTLNGQLDLSRRTAIRADLLAERQAEDRTGYDAITNARSPVRYSHFRAALTGSQDFSPVTLTGGVDFNRFDFDNAVSRAGLPLSQRYRTFDQFGANAVAAYTVYPGLAVIVRGSIDKRTYDLDAGDPRQPDNLERGSSGGRIEAGVRFDVTSLLYGEARIGYLRRSYRDDRFRDTAGLSFGGDLLWNVTPLTTLRLTADRRIDEASSTLISGNRTSEFNLRVDHELLRNLILSGALRYARISPVGPLDKSAEYGGRAGARYLFSRRTSFEAGYVFAKRTSPSFDRRFTQNRVSAGVRLTF